MSRRDRFVFRTMVPRSVRRAARVLAVSESTKRDLVEYYGISEERIVVTPNGVGLSLDAAIWSPCLPKMPLNGNLKDGGYGSNGRRCGGDRRR